MSENINPEKFFSKGSKYVETTGNIWDQRKWKLINKWSITENPDKKKRIDFFIKILESRLRVIWKSEYRKKEEKIKAHIEAGEMLVKLECPSFDCRYGPDAYGTAIRYQDYEPGKLKCDKCGLPLREQNQREVDNMLLEIGVDFGK